MFVHRRSDGKEQFDRVMAAVKAAPELIALGKDGRGDERFTSRDMLETEQRLEHAADRLAMRVAHGLPAAMREKGIIAAGSGSLRLGQEQQAALQHVSRAQDLSIVVGYAGTGKSTILGVAREQWERAGYCVTGATLSGIAAENLESGSGIATRTLASLEHQWSQDRDQLTSRDVLLIDEAGMIGSRQMERVLSEAAKRGAKVVLVGDPEQLQAIEAGAAFRSLAERHGAIEITEVRRQRENWQRGATRHLATERTGEAIRAYDEHGAVHAVETREQARADLIERWDRDRRTAPEASRIILTHTNDEVRELNIAARGRLREADALGDDVAIHAERGTREFASGDRVMFLRNERSLGVKNGSLGIVESVSPARMSVMLDDGRAVAFDIKDYAAIDHGYAATIHKAQGMTVDRVHVLATPGLDRHAAYVALSRHRDAVDLHYGRDDFADQTKLVRTLSRERAKDMASDFTRAPTSRGRADIDWRQINLPLPVVPTAAQIPAARVKEPTPAIERPVAPPSLEQATVAFARATAEIVRMRRQNLEELPHQRAAFDQARVALDGIRPDGARDLRAAFSRDMKLIDEFAAGKAGIANSVIDWELRYRTDPQFRADHFVKTWRQLGDRHEVFERRGEDGQARRIAAQMTAFAQGLERDPQVESLLRKRPNDLGLPPYLERPLSQALPDFIGWGTGRGIGR
jgi:hypothetical protein